MAESEQHRVPSRALFAHMHALIARGDDRLELLGETRDAVEIMRGVEAVTRESTWNMQRFSSLAGLRRTHGHLEASIARGIRLRSIVRPGALVRNPLASSVLPWLRTAPVTDPLMVLDRARVIVGGPEGETLWTSTDPELVARAVAFYERVWDAAAPAVPDGEDPPFTPRMVRLAFLLTDGASDRDIAAALGVSQRTVSADLRELSHRLGTTSRARTIARLSGAL